MNQESQVRIIRACPIRSGFPRYTSWPPALGTGKTLKFLETISVAERYDINLPQKDVTFNFVTVESSIPIWFK